MTEPRRCVTGNPPLRDGRPAGVGQATPPRAAVRPDPGKSRLGAWETRYADAVPVGRDRSSLT